MREVIGKSNLQFAQTEGAMHRAGYQDLLQRMLDEYRLACASPKFSCCVSTRPQEVIAAFRDVQAARADKEKSINEANTYRNQVLPRAKGEGRAIIQRGEAMSPDRRPPAVMPSGLARLRAVRQGPRYHHRAHLSRHHGGGAAQREQSAGRQEHVWNRRAAVPPAARVQPDEPTAAPAPAAAGPGRHPMTNRAIIILVGLAVAIPC